MTLKRLLKWAKKEGLYIEIYADGSAMVENGKNGYKFLVYRHTLHSALMFAKQELEMK